MHQKDFSWQIRTKFAPFCPIMSKKLVKNFGMLVAFFLLLSSGKKNAKNTKNTLIWRISKKTQKNSKKNVLFPRKGKMCFYTCCVVH